MVTYVWYVAEFHASIRTKWKFRPPDTSKVKLPWLQHSYVEMQTTYLSKVDKMGHLLPRVNWNMLHQSYWFWKKCRSSACQKVVKIGIFTIQTKIRSPKLQNATMCSIKCCLPNFHSYFTKATDTSILVQMVRVDKMENLLCAWNCY